jgi:hypothetical protein
VGISVSLIRQTVITDKEDTEHWILEGKQIKLMLLWHVLLDKKKRSMGRGFDEQTLTELIS